MKSVATRFVGVAMRKSRVVSGYCSREILELYYLSVQLHQTWTGISEQSSGSGTNICGKQYVVPGDPFSILRVAIIKPSFTSESEVLQ